MLFGPKVEGLKNVILGFRCIKLDIEDLNSTGILYTISLLVYWSQIFPNKKCCVTLSSNEFLKGSCSLVSLSVKLLKKVWNWKHWLYCYLELILSYKVELDLRITIKWIILIIEGTQGLQVFRMQCINFLLRRLINLCCRNWFTNWKGNKNKNKDKIQVLFSRIYNYDWAYSCLIIVLHLLLINRM